MNTLKNILLAWISAGSPIIAAVGIENGLFALSAIVLPIVFFAIGKTVDVLLQIYLDGKNRKGRKEANGVRSPQLPKEEITE